MNAQELVIKIVGDVTDFENKMQRLSKNFDDIGKNFSRASTPFLIAGGAITGSLAALIMKSAKTGDEFNDMSQRTGIAVEDLSRLKFAADVSGTSIDGVETSLKFLTRAMDDASSGSGKAYDAFKSLGVSVTDAEGNLRPIIDVMKDAATKITEIDNPAKQAAATMELFGARAGTDLLPLLKMGGEGIDELMKKADDLGVTISTKSATAADEFNDKLTGLKEGLTGVAAKLGTSLMPTIMRFIDDHIVPLIDRLNQIPIEKLQKGIEILAGVGGFLLLMGAVGKTISVFANFAAILTNPTSGIIFAISLLVLGIIEIVKHWEDIKKAFEKFYEKYIEPWFVPLKKAFEWLLDTIGKIFGWFSKGMDKISIKVEGGVPEIGQYAGGFASGGSFVVSKPTMFLAGERGTEYVNIVPQGQASGINVTYNIYGANDTESLRRALKEHDNNLLNALRGGRW
ncbi:MAG: phage tail tape measure protein [Ignavibacteriales bacterium]|nr:phage tail tape measure protein [Ignavibacteriales bacterium]